MIFTYNTVDKITADLHGFYKISHEAYHRGPGISSTKVKKALVSHAAYHHEEDHDRAALSFGRAFHAALVEPAEYERKWAQVDGHPNSNAYKSAKAEIQAQGKEVISDDDTAAIIEMVSCVKEHPDYARFAAHHPEVMGVTTCDDTGLQIKCKADLFGDVIVDFKSTSSAITPGDFLGDVVKWRYHVSAAFYQDIIAKLTGQKLPFIVVPVTKKAPYECEFYRLHDELLEEGRKLYKAGLRRIARWYSQKIGKNNLVDKRLRVLRPNARVFYTTTDILNFIEGS